MSLFPSQNWSKIHGTGLALKGFSHMYALCMGYKISSKKECLGSFWGIFIFSSKNNSLGFEE